MDAGTAASRLGTSEVWRARWNRRGPLWVSLALTALIVADLVRPVGALIDLSSRDPPPLAAVRARAPPRAEVDAQRIAAAHLFGIAAADPAEQDPDRASPAPADLTLAGTIATADPLKGIAIIGDRGRFEVFSTGEAVGEALLRSVYAARVILVRNGVLESLSLPRPASGQLHFGPTRPRAGAGGESTADEPRTEKSPLDRIIDSDFVGDSDETLGLRVTPGADKALFSRCGLIGGDVIMAVNGMRLATPERARELWKHAWSGTTVTVLRSGVVERTLDITLNFD